ncbi:T-cell activation inhibitor, mitochondrial-like [Penaeus japonicus]|uniref:T-cell activation inhibitor, mitochondrial-like n=1 Tax=Penaeus japonicus TaxID=27405 RepID=UPI001C717866|nr:T-cell activation inhibitor, mitochondrial-like [Penaeus japonicus]
MSKLPSQDTILAGSGITVGYLTKLSGELCANVKLSDMNMVVCNCPLFHSSQGMKDSVRDLKQKLLPSFVISSKSRQPYVFYFLVHPDLFGQFPRAQHINDASLKSLNSHLDSLINHKKPHDTTQYNTTQHNIVHNTTQHSTIHYNNLIQHIAAQSALYTAHGILHTVAVQLNKTTARATVHDLLSEFDLPTKYVDSLPEKAGKPDREIRWHHSFYDATGTINPYEDEYTARTRQKLVVARPETTHLRGCMQGLTALTAHHQEIKEILEGRAIHFGNETGISLSGSLVLSTSEVRNQWLKVCLNLCYVGSSNVIHSHRYPKSWPETLSNIQLVVESASGPLMVSPTGQILVPSSCPPAHLVNFITENMGEAERMINNYKSVRWREKALHQQCKKELGLDFLEKDDSVTPDMMAECLGRLLEASYRLSPLLSGARVWVTHYYTVMLDGEICIPWNWDKEKY